MAHPQTVASKTMAAVERARNEVKSFKETYENLIQTTANAGGEAQNLARSLIKHIETAETHVEKADATVKRIKVVGRIPPRPTASVPASVRAKRALSVLLAGVDVEKTNITAEGAANAARNVRQKLGTGMFLSAAGKPCATPIREDELNNVLKRAVKETDLKVGRVGDRGVGFECRNVFRAFMWFKEVEVPKGEKLPPVPKGGKPLVFMVPEHIGCFRVDELSASRWSCSKHAIFNILTERAQAAIRYFMARESKGEDAFVALAQWLARHKNLFSAKNEERRLAFDASRGIFLPACVHAFDGSGDGRFTRGSIPMKNNSAPPTVRIPSASQSQPSHPPASAAQTSHPPGGQPRSSGAVPPMKSR